MNDEQELQQTDGEVFELPPEALAEVAATTSAPLGALTRERLDELNVDPSLAKPEETGLLAEYVLGGRDWPEAVAPTETAEEAAAREANEAAEAAAAAGEPEVPAAIAGAVTTTPPDEDEVDVELEAGREQIKSITELRTSYRADKERLDAILDKPEPDNEYSDEYKAWVKEQRTARREKDKITDEFNDKLAEATAGGSARSIAVRESEKFMASFDKVAVRHTEVKLDRPFKAANEAYRVWLDSLVAKAGITDGTQAEKINAAYTKYQADPEFAKTVPAPKDLQQVQILNEARVLVEAVGGKRTLEGAVLEVLSSKGLLNKRVDAAAVAASQANAQRTQEALARARTAPATAPLTGGSKAPKMLAIPVDLETATAYMTNLLDKRKRPGAVLTPFETRHEDAAKQFLGIDKVR